MKKLIFAMVVFMVFGVAALQAGPQSQDQAAKMEMAIGDTMNLAPHYGVFDTLSFKLEGSDVTLLGQVMLPITKEEVARRVAKIAGIGKITNSIEVLPLSNSDDAIRLQVYRRLFGAADLYRYALSPNPSIHIVVKGGRVTLEGVVSNEMDSRLAYNASRNINGVFSVANNLKIEK